MTWWDRSNIYILTFGGIAVLIYMIINWAALTPLQIALSFFIFGITLHEWEETRFPGGFYKLMTGMIGVNNSDQAKIECSHGCVVIAIVFFAYIPFFFNGVHWLALVPAILGIFESFIHIVGIKIHHLKHFYSPGMLTALLFLLPPSIFIIVYAAPGVGWEWVLTFVYYFAVFFCMELAVWGVFGIKPKDFPKIAKRARAYVLGKKS
ncbi:HXXEE domain-containing protein [Adlercreutzia sp. ZJ304]|uniref:HXXEE domain-containing protein n=1 Tax=Adlercreutzia sp. ZJ304 TaxID=2709791 RepID=UPI0013EC682B|nr:HXXEE domain-containing protein [Adlercreutzia sp. ZJ304]